MECKVCRYPLWKLYTRQCPECGEAFRVDEFEFAANMVAFCCPHCDQAYYGTDEHGRLVPRSFACVNCGRHVDMNEMVLRPAAGIKDDQTRPERNAFVNRHEIGRLKAWFITIGQAMARPGLLIRSTPTDSVAAAWGFALLVMLAVALMNGVGVLAFMLLMRMLLAGGAGSGPGRFEVGTFFVMVLAPLLGSLGFMVIWGLVTQGMLAVTGRRRSTIGRTYQALGFSHGVTILAAVPCFGFYLLAPAWLWWAISATLMVRAGHEISGWRASVAVLIWPLVALLAGATLIGMGMYQTTQAMQSYGPLMRVQSVATAIDLSAHRNNGRLPEHPAELTMDGLLHASDFILPGSGTNLQTIDVGSTTLFQFSRDTLEDRRRALREAEQALPDAGEPFRFGDYVFAHRALDRSQHPDMWAAVGYSTPLQHVGRTYRQPLVYVIRMDGHVLELSKDDFERERDRENERRDALGLKPIPDVTQSAPAAGQAGG